MNNNFNLSDDKVNALLQMAAQKLGKDPADLKNQLEAGNLDNLTKNLDAKSTNQINTMLQNPKAAEILLSNDKVRNMLNNFLSGNK